jgi:hypothetical protein
MATPKLEKTKTPGIYKRGGVYAVVFRVDGKQRKEFAPTYDAARRLKARRTSQVADGEYRPQSKLTFAAYFRPWIRPIKARAAASESAPAATTPVTASATRSRSSVTNASPRSGARTYASSSPGSSMTTRRPSVTGARTPSARPPDSRRSARPAHCATRPSRGSWPC